MAHQTRIGRGWRSGGERFQHSPTRCKRSARSASLYACRSRMLSLRGTVSACTLRPVRKFFWQRLALIFLLMSRLVIGELGHAMAVDAADSMSPATHHGAHHDARDGAYHEMGGTSSASSDGVVTCAAHESGKYKSPATHDSDRAASASSHSLDEHASGEQDCCTTGECECPCLQVPCAALDGLVVNSSIETSVRYPQGADGLLIQRPFRLFRPPARTS